MLRLLPPYGGGLGGAVSLLGRAGVGLSIMEGWVGLLCYNPKAILSMPA